MELFIIVVLSTIALVISIMSIMGIIKSKEINAKILYTLFIYSFLILILLISYTHKPKAIDVYKGKTTLEITYKDKVPIDTTVVWK